MNFCDRLDAPNKNPGYAHIHQQSGLDAPAAAAPNDKEPTTYSDPARRRTDPADRLLQ